jgi:chromosome segregation ATPase
MCCIGKSIFRWGLIGGLAITGLSLASPGFRHVVGTSIDQVKSTASTAMDSVIEDPIVLRRQLQTLANEYPDRINEVNGELAKVDTQIAQIHDEIEVSERVVAMTTDDLTELKTLVARAEAREASGVRTVAIRFEGSKFDVDEAYTEARRINAVRENYKDRLAHDSHQVTFLQEQRGRLQEILTKLETEFDTFQVQLWNLDRQIDAIERNERLIELTESQQETLEDYDRLGRVGNLKQLESKLAELRRVQDAQLESLSKRNVRSDYETRAKFDLGTDDLGEGNPFADLDVDQISNDQDDDESSDHDVVMSDTDKALAFAESTIIER